MSSVSVSSASLSAVAGKNVIITGGSTGIGEAAVKLLHGNWHVAVAVAVARELPCICHLRTDRGAQKTARR
jgi:NAD(P)-dependent dehydrogenase (short-subunit alcohol dehydrogenase family)